MHENGINQQPIRKRVLSKVRRQFLNKRSDEDGLAHNHILPQNSPNETVHSINPSVGLFEVNGKVFVDAHYFNLYYNMTCTIIEDLNRMKAVMVHLCQKENLIQNCLESVAKKLESYGDLELATWAHRIRRNQANYPRIMAEYFELMRSDDSEIFLSLKRAKTSAILKCKDIESKYPYCKVLQFFGKESNKLLSCTYSEWFLKEVDHTIESFVAWSKKNGLLHFIDNNCSLYLDFAKQVLEGFSLKNGSVYEGSEYHTSFSDKNGDQKRTNIQSITILEPSSDGYFLYGYFILKRDDTTSGIPKAEQGHKSLKQSKDAKPAAIKSLPMLNQPPELTKEIQVNEI